MKEIMMYLAANRRKLILISVCVIGVYCYYRFGTSRLSFLRRSSDDLAASRRLESVLSSSKHDGRKTDSENLDEKTQAKGSQLLESTVKGIDVFILFSKAKDNYLLRQKFSVMLNSMLEFSSVQLNLHIIGDDESQDIAKKMIHKLQDRKGQPFENYVMKSYGINTMVQQLHRIIKSMQKYFSPNRGTGAYFSDPLFLLSIAIHRVVPESIHKAIMLDVDLKFKTDIRKLYNLFSNFTPSQVIGIANEMQPVYRHVFAKYRQSHPGTKVGEPPPKGKPGFNSGVLLLDLDSMRRSQVYNMHIDEKNLKLLASKYSFQGHLGDQGFFTLLGMEFDDLFYVLPCTWNRQLCKWWRDKGYEQIFDFYHTCDGEVNIYHGNCNTAIPESDG